MKELIRLIDISTNSNEYTNLHHFFLNIFPGQVHYLLGLHGSGKSTLRDILCGYLAPASGTLIINGSAFSSYTAKNARANGIISIDQNASPLVSSLPVYENMEIFFSAAKKGSIFHLFDRKKVLTKLNILFQKYNLSINPFTKIYDLSVEDIFFLYLLEAEYVNANLIILNLSNLKLSFMDMKKAFHILKQLNSQGISLLFICDSFFNQPLLPGTIHIIRKGRIIKQYHSSEINAAQINELLIPSKNILSRRTSPASSSIIIGIMELYYSNYSLPEYFSKLEFFSANTTNNISSSIKYIKAASLDCFCDKLSIGDNIALVRYPSIAEYSGYIDHSILTYFEKSFHTVLSEVGAPTANSMADLNMTSKKILGIERWIMAGVQKLVIEDPLSGLDANGQQILLRYIQTLRDHGIQLIFIFYNTSELQKICDTVHICEHGKIKHSIQKDSGINLEDVIPL